MEELKKLKCVPCEGGVDPMKSDEINKYLELLQNDWKVLEEGKKIEFQFKFNNFKEAITFINKVAKIAEEEGHHPNIYIDYSKVTITLWTHAIEGLSINDFVLAAKIESILN